MGADKASGLLAAQIVSLRHLIAFDAVQVLCRPAPQDNHLVMLCEGYGSASRRALAEVFPALYPPGFTELFSPGDGLPPSICESNDVVQPAFRATEIYIEALSREGFQDGLTIELRSGTDYFGLVHFSARRPTTFTRDVRMMARGFQVSLEATLGSLMPRPDKAIVAVLRRRGNALVAVEAVRDQGSVVTNRLLTTLSCLPPEAMPLQCCWVCERPYLLKATPVGNEDLLIELLPQPLPVGLSYREMVVLSWLMIGMADRDIAAEMFISERTVHSHVTALLRKLKAKRRSQAAIIAALNRWFIPDPAGKIASGYASVMR
ncbi:MAG: LuxR family transcriptional regulator [Rhodopseudomonas palustris]|nr:MAG: LuxR family transcriptional regulator [Rhodopseudomonas palustris]